MDLKYGHGEVGSHLNRHDLSLTSTGRGHYYTKGYYFPPSNFRRTVNDDLPPPLAVPNMATPNDQIANYYHTTNGTVHDYKYMNGVLGNPRHKRAAGSWKVHYIKDNADKLKTREWTEPLTMGNQRSEMRDKYRAARGLSLDKTFSPWPQPFNLAGHHQKGSSQQVIATTHNKAMTGKPFFVRDKEVLKLNDVYLTTSQKSFRSYKHEELLDYPKKDYVTYWECEEYPTAWGHGSKLNPLPKESVPRERPPMRDPTWFPSATKIPRLPKPQVLVPHKGMETLVQGSFKGPADVKGKEMYLCPVDTPYVTTISGPKDIMTVPKMYKTEYMTYGGGRPVTVT